MTLLHGSTWEAHGHLSHGSTWLIEQTVVESSTGTLLMLCRTAANHVFKVRRVQVNPGLTALGFRESIRL